MGVVQLGQDAAGPASLLGLAGGYLLGNPERKAKKAQQDIENKRNAASDARLDGESADRARNTADEIADRDKTLQITQGNNDVKTRSAVAYAKYAPMMDTVPKGPDGKALQGPALQNALNQIKNKAIGEGLQGEDLARLMTDAQATMQQNAPKLQDVTHGMQQLPVAKPAGKDGKGGVAGATPEQEVRHWMDAASKVANSDMDPDAKKTAIAMYQKNAADALARVPKPETPADAERKRHDLAIENKPERPQRPDHFGEVTPAQKHTQDLEDKRYALEQKRFDAEFPGGKKAPPKPGKSTALDEVKAARAHGIKDNSLIINTLMANGHTEASARAAVKAVP